MHRPTNATVSISYLHDLHDPHIRGEGYTNRVTHLRLLMFQGTGYRNKSLLYEFPLSFCFDFNSFLFAI